MTVREAWGKFSSALEEFSYRDEHKAFIAGWNAAMESLVVKKDVFALNDHIPPSNGELIGLIWQAWPIKKARGAAIPAIKKALKTRGSDLLNDVQAYANAIKTWPADEKKYVPMCSTWMNQERWLDDRSTWIKGAAAQGSQFSRVN